MNQDLVIFSLTETSRDEWPYDGLFQKRKTGSTCESLGTIAVVLANEQPFLQYTLVHVKPHNKLISGILKVNLTVKTH